MDDFAGQVAIISGATELGETVARAFARAGALVVVSDRDAIVAQRTADLVRSAGRAECVTADPSDPDAAATLVAEARRLGGRVNVLVQHYPASYRGLALAAQPAEWRLDMERSLSAAFFLARAFALVAEPHGAIVNIASIDLAQAYSGRVTGSTAVNGLVGLSRALSVEWARVPLRVNVVAPGIMLSAAERDAIHAGSRSLDRVLLRAPGHRLGTLKETASAVLFLASSRADFITGQTLYVDGGWAALTQHAEGLRFP